MGAPWHKLHSKLDRALVAYLIEKQCGTVANILPAKRALIISAYPATVCYARRRVPRPLYSGRYDIETDIIIMTSAALDDPSPNPEAEAAAAETLRKDSDEFIGKTLDALNLMEAQDGRKLADAITASAYALAAADPAKHADLADFTCHNVVEQEGDCAFDENGIWMETVTFLISCSPSAIA